MPDALLPLLVVGSLLDLDLYHFVKLRKQILSHLLLNILFRLLVPILLRLYLDLAVGWIECLINLSVASISILNQFLLLDKALAWFVIFEIAAFIFIIPQVMLIVIHHFAHQAPLLCRLVQIELVIISVAFIG